MVGADGSSSSSITRRWVSPPPHHGASPAWHLLLSLLVLLVFSTVTRPCHGRGDAHGGKSTVPGGKCLEREREALLAVRDDVWRAVADHDHPTSWERDGDDCCSWKGVACDHRSGHVVKLDLRSYTKYGKGSAGRTVVKSKVNPSLLNLGSLRYLDLSGNDFGRYSLPSFIGSLVNLEYLNISEAGFSGSIPPELGNLLNLKSLDLGYNHFNTSSFIWLSHLSHLQYLDMSRNDLSAAHDWLRVISVLPSLSVLRLQHCFFPSHPYSTVLLSLGNFTSLSTLDLGNHLGSPNSTWPLWLSNVSGLTTLILYPLYNCTIPSDAFKNMKHLEVLRLMDDRGDHGDGFRGVIPRSLWMLNKLKILHLSGQDLHIGPYEDVGSLSSLQELALSGVVDRLPDSLWNIMGLRSLSIRGARGFELPESIGNLVGLKTLRLFGFNNTSGKMLRYMGDHLCNLTELTIGSDKANGGEVTSLLEFLSECNGGSALESLDIRDNGYSGHLPNQLVKLKNLREVALSGNSIVGSIPASIGELESLTRLDLSNNQLSGHVPTSIGKLSNLVRMIISSNRLEGALSEAHFSHLSQLKAVYLSHNAVLSLNTSQTWIPPFQLSSFDMSACHVGPEFPKWLRTQKILVWLDLSSNNISSSPELSDDLFMYYFNLSHNDIKGILPASLLSVGYTIDLSNNSFEASPLVLSTYSVRILHLSHNLIFGPLFVNNTFIGPLEYLDLSYNKIQGSIPSTICQFESLVILDMSYNHFSGQLLDCWNSSKLEVLKLSNNSLVGQIPSSIGMLSDLQVLHLDKNALIGSIPSSLGSCNMLETLDLSENKLSGEIPSWLGHSLSSLKILSLRSNMFHGNLPASLSELQSLRILDLACNKLSGSVLLSFHNFSEMVNIEKQIVAPYVDYNLYISVAEYRESISIVSKRTALLYTSNLGLVTMINLSSNNLSGKFPREITNLLGLLFLNLSRNHLSGTIPENISNMRQLQSLDLSFNQLSGSLPSRMSDMNFLGVFNVSYNSLSGPIPSGQIQNFDQYSFIGNCDLCGAPTLRPCPGDATFHGPFQTSEEDAFHENEASMAWLYVSVGPGFVTGFLGFLGVLSLMGRSWRIAFFRFFDDLGDTLYVFVMVRYARLKRKLSAWRGGEDQQTS